MRSLSLGRSPLAPLEGVDWPLVLVCGVRILGASPSGGRLFHLLALVSSFA